MEDQRRPAIRLTLACLALAGLFAAYHFVLRGVMLATGLQLGAVRPGRTVYRIVPLYIYWHPHVKLMLLFGIGVVAAFLCWFGRVAWRRGRSGPAIVAALMAWQAAIACGVAMIDPPARLRSEPKNTVKRPWQKLWEPYAVHHASEYITAVARIESPRQFLHDYARLMPELPLHCRHHPPGGPLFLWLVGQVFGAGVIPASLATIAVASLAVPAVYLLARDVLDEGPARLAVAFYMLAPNVVCYSATCMDAVFNVPMVWSIYFLWMLRRRPVGYGIAAGAASAWAALMTFSASFLALWAAVLLVLTALADRRRLANTAVGLAAAAATAIFLYFGLYFASGYDPWAVLQEAFAGQDRIMEGHGHSSLRQSLHFSLANLSAFLFCSGLPLTVLWSQQIFAECRGATASPGRWLLASFAAALAILDLAPLYTLETERIWIFMVPFLAIGAATRLTSTPTAPNARGDDANCGGLSLPARTALVLLAAQTVIMEALFDWFW